jgi:hypothetical protein
VPTDVRAALAAALVDQKITREEMEKILAEVKESDGAITSDERVELAGQVRWSWMEESFEPDALDLLEAFLTTSTADVIRVETGSNAGSLADDSVFLIEDGFENGDTGIKAYTRSYDAIFAGPLRYRNGSEAPAHGSLSAEEVAKLRAMTPGNALDEAARIFGAPTGRGFEAMANSRQFFNPDAEGWWGKCHAWAWSALNTWVNEKVDVAGPEGERGLWIAGQWLSRADLGNWMMAVADTISTRDSNILFDTGVTPEELLKGMVQYLMDPSGGGVVADIDLDRNNPGGAREVWNQPFIGASMDAQTLTGPVAEAILAKAGVAGGVTVKLVQAVGRYGVEVGDHHEDDPAVSNREWNMYVVTDAQGKVLKGIMADDDALQDIADLPLTWSDELPEYWWKPTNAAIEDVIAGRTNALVERNALGKEFKFFLNTVLGKGVSAATRKAFEDEALTITGFAGQEKVAELAAKYPGVANAYSPAEWQKLFLVKGLTAQKFGAAW